MNIHALMRVVLFVFLLSPALVAQVVVFWQPGFPTVASRPVDRATLSAALHPAFVDLKALQATGALDQAGGDECEDVELSGREAELAAG